jgi:hypothetical protein
VSIDGLASPADDRLFAWVLSTLGGVSNITDVTGTKGILRDDWPASSLDRRLPRVEYNPFRFSLEEDGTRMPGQFGVTVLADRSAGAYGSGDNLENEGDLWTLEFEVLNALANVRPSTSDFKWSLIECTARRRPTLSNEQVVTRRLNFGVTAYPGSVVPLSGSDADLEGLGSNLEVIGWNASVDGTVNYDFTGVEDGVLQARTDRSLARIQIRARLVGDGTTLFPARGSRVSTTFVVDSDTSFSASMLISRIDWVPNQQQPQSPQIVVINGIVDDETTAFFDGTP